MRTTTLHHVALLSAFAGTACGQGPVTYDDQVRPIFVARCLSCHNPDKARADVDLSSYRTLMAGGSGGAIVTPGNPEGSTLVGVVSHTREPNMPPKGDRIPEAEIATAAPAIDDGAVL
ncbi:MAG: c-type cytochrome domain-containing protein, partial [Phycisphaerales bacterium]